MVAMPCSIRISKMIILSMEVGIVSTMVDVAAILLTQKSFFIHEEKRENIEEFMHSMVGYDN
jgi:HrpA-like RNA helicase